MCATCEIYAVRFTLYPLSLATPSPPPSRNPREPASMTQIEVQECPLIRAEREASALWWSKDIQLFWLPLKDAKKGRWCNSPTLLGSSASLPFFKSNCPTCQSLGFFAFPWLLCNLVLQSARSKWLKSGCPLAPDFPAFPPTPAFPLEECRRRVEDLSRALRP